MNISTLHKLSKFGFIALSNQRKSFLKIKVVPEDAWAKILRKIKPDDSFHV